MNSRRDRILRLRPLVALAVLCGALYVVLFPPTASTHPEKPACGPTPVQIVVQNGRVRVYRVPVGHDASGTLHAYYGCVGNHGKPELLAKPSDSRWNVEIRLNGVFVGVLLHSVSLDFGGDSLTVRNLETGHDVHTVRARWVVSVGQHLDEFVLGPSGNVAWSIQGSPIGAGPAGPGNLVVIRRAIGQTVTTLDQGPDTRLRARSLRLRGNTVVWVDGGTQRHAPLT